MYEGLELLTDALSIVGESPVWLERERAVVYVDIRGKSVRRYHPDSGRIEDTIYPQMIAFLVETESGELLGGAQDGIYHLDRDGGITRVNRPFDLKGERFNDGKVGPDGRLYMGTFCRDRSAAFYRMDCDGTVTELFDGVGNSNGLDWDEANDTLYYCDTPTLRTDAFDFHRETGTISNRRTVFEYSQGAPDGMCIDEQGNLWTALWGAGKVVCVDPCRGKIIRSVDLPVSQPSCCCFWGDRLDELAITSAAAGRSLYDEPLAGALFSIHPGVCGKKRKRIRPDRRERDAL